MKNPEHGGSEKQRRWHEIETYIGNAVDKVEREIDPEIVETCTALTALGFPTTNSCGGHFNTDRPKFPYIRISVGPEPEEKFIGQTDLRKRLAEKYGITIDEVEEHSDAMREHDLAYEDEDYQETRSYKEWCERGGQLCSKLRDLLSEFVQEVENYGTLQMTDKLSGNFELDTIDPRKAIAMKQMTPEIIDRIKMGQEDMLKFGQWLKRRYFSEAK